MVRPRQFDESEARQALMMAFLRLGYEGASLPDLEKATGMGRRSLYNAFGDKRAMFARALDDFIGLVVEENLTPLRDGPGGRAAIVTMFESLLTRARTPEGRFGCLVCNTAREAIAAEDRKVGARVERYFARIASAMRHAVEAGQARGEIPVHHDAEALGRCLMATVVSLSVLARGGAEEPVLRAIVSETMRLLD